MTAPSGEDLYERFPLIRRLVDDPNLEKTEGVMSFGDRLYHAAIAPVGVGQPRQRIAYLVNASAIDQKFANRIADKAVVFGF